MSAPCSRPGEAFLLGVDLKKSEDVLIPAYDDPLGVTAAFNLNLLGRINRELGGDFDLSSFRHRARYNREAGRIEMHLESRRAQTVPIRVPGDRGPLRGRGDDPHGKLLQVRPGPGGRPGRGRRASSCGGPGRTGRGRFSSNLLVAV